jgi:hypothetical protein
MRTGHDGNLGLREAECLDATGLNESRETERLHGGTQIHDRIGIAHDPADGPIARDFYDRTAMTALDDSASELADEDRRRLRAFLCPSHRPGGPGTGRFGGLFRAAVR